MNIGRDRFLRRYIILGLSLLLVTAGARSAAMALGGKAGISQSSSGNRAVPGAAFVRYFPILFTGGDGQVELPEYGLNFISSAEDQADETQYANGMRSGVEWNRWPLYWYRAEQTPGSFDWAAHDDLVTKDIAHGLRINAILMGTPSFYQTLAGTIDKVGQPSPYKSFAMSASNGSAPAGLFSSVFADGTDLPGSNKHINGENKWAEFVFAAVSRYMPGGILSRQLGWQSGIGISHWEMWNEPDLSFFWNGTAEQYARLLKVGYLAAKHADANAKILFGGLANNTYNCSQPDPSAPHFLDQILNLFDSDPTAHSHGYFHDVLATHNYSRSWDSFCLVFRAERSLARHGLEKPIWLNETGVPAWDDYPGPVWDPGSPFRATMSEQADFTIQTVFYATWAGADNIFHFQLYDGCGNQPAGTDFPPHHGELCDKDGNLVGNPQFPCAGDANGFYRNPSDAACFTQHPIPESGRPKLAALQALTTHLQGVVPLDRKRPGGINGPQEWISFYRAGTNQRIMGLWARFGDNQTALVPAVSGTGTALLIASDGSSQTITASGGVYTIHLPGATNQNTPWDLSTGYPIGGKTFILIETVAN